MDLNTFSNSLKTSQPNHQKLQSFKGFQNYFEELSRDILGKITYSNRHLADEIFKFNCPKKHEKQIFKKHLYAAGSTIKRLSEEISENNISSYNYLLRRLVHDLYDIVVFGEQQFRNKILNYGFIGMSTSP